MMLPNAWDATEWLWPAVLLIAGAGLVVVFSYRRSAGSRGLRMVLAGMKILAIALMALCLLEPMVRFERPEPGANLVMVMADDSQSLQIKDVGETETREQQLKRVLTEQTGWMERISENFDVRRYQVDQSLRPVANFSQFAADRRGTNLLGNLAQVARRFDGRPAAGIVLLTDGNDLHSDQSGLVELQASIDWETMPPIYPVVIGGSQSAADLAITRVVSTQTNFETAPVSINAELFAEGLAGRKISVALLDESGETLEQKEIAGIEAGQAFVVRFQTQPKHRGVNVYQVRAVLASEQDRPLGDTDSMEATIVNNRQSIVVNRGRGPFRVLYVAGRPNWEMKFLRRAMLDDPEVNLVALLRIAKREAKFTFRGREGQQSNSLFRGFASQDDDTTEQYDEPVFLRLGTRDAEELRGGFPKDAATLFSYDAIVIDDLESGFFNEDQKTLIQQFVSLRGGGFLMLGGQESFAQGGYDRTPIGEMLPVYLDRIANPPTSDGYRLELTREGWLQPWVRVASTEAAERTRMEKIPAFRTINRTDSIKPGASVLATVAADGESRIPSLVVQSYGNGRTAALLVGDFWRWYLRTEDSNDDLMKAWRQMMRWLTADVPRRVELTIKQDIVQSTSNQIEIRVKTEEFLPDDNAEIKLSVVTPDGKELNLDARPLGSEAGAYVSQFSGTRPGVYRAQVTACAEDGSEIESREVGWVCDPDRDEFRALTPNRELLAMLAEKSGGKLIEFDDMSSLPGQLETSPVPVSQQRSEPWWHRWLVFSMVASLLVAEWGIRRWKGMP